MSALRRDIAPFLQRLRAFLLGREHTVALRFEDGLADRTQPPPEIPYPVLRSDCYYHGRDPRRIVAPPVDLVKENLKLAADSKPVASLPTPGKVYKWD
ncbi:NADH dehydrogenase (ubiquinone) B14.5 A subunit [Haematobia irritans]|uniref:NADH dehydrogenase [ubiquinone] 1 alpha subcomplex subunit 7 n=1 Tax=Haematobia irritans TaxID=7368 RepID=A0A1L8EEK0_HAEIR